MWARIGAGTTRTSVCLSLPILILAITLTREAGGSTVTPKDGEDSRGTTSMTKIKIELALLVIVGFCVFVSQSWADTVVVVCKSDFQLALVDPAAEKILLKLPTGLGPHEVAVSPDGRTAFVSNFGRYSVYP